MVLCETNRTERQRKTVRDPCLMLPSLLQREPICSVIPDMQVFPLKNKKNYYIEWERWEWEIKKRIITLFPRVRDYYTKTVFTNIKLIAKIKQGEGTGDSQKLTSGRTRKNIALVFPSDQIQMDNVVRMVWITLCFWVPWSIFHTFWSIGCSYS